MIVTNKQGLPESFVRFAQDSKRGFTPHRYSVTELLLPIREIILNRQHVTEIEEDVVDMIPAMFGTAVHELLEHFSPFDPKVLTEEPVEWKIGEDVVSGRIDVLDVNNSKIADYKTCSVSKVMKQDFDDWYMQGLMYAYLVSRRAGAYIRHLEFYALMKDWSKFKSMTSSNYPSSAIYVWKRDLQDSDYDFIEAWLKERLDKINEYLGSKNLPECTDEEKWYTGTKYAVYKKHGDARAAIVCDTEEEAKGYLANKCPEGELVVRKGDYLKCKYYCSCCKFCK